jgi:predicted outer membrane protein
MHKQLPKQFPKCVPMVIAAVLGASALVSSALIRAADNYTEAEIHVLRGLSERQSTVNRFNKLAAEKGSTELVRLIAQKDLDEHTKLNEEVSALAKKIGITGVGGGMPPGAGGAPGAGGPPSGAGPQAGGAGPSPGQSQPPGNTPGGMAGGPPNGGGAGAGGPGAYASRYYAELEKLSGAEFDEKYLLRSLQYHEDMERTLNVELRDGVNPELLAWTKSHIKQYEQHATLIQRVLFGEVTSIKAEQPLGAEMRNDGPGGGPPPSKPVTDKIK